MGLFDGLGSAIVGGAIGLIGGKDTNSAAAAQSKAQMDFQERMSDTAHQREVADLTAAGLNPILSATGGSGASTPIGSAAPVQNVADSAVRGANSAMDNSLKSKQLDQIDAQIAQTKAATAQSQTQAALNTASIGKVQADQAYTNSAAVNNAVNNVLMKTKIPQAQNDANVHSGLTGKILSYLNAIGIGSDAVSSAASAHSAISAISK